MNDQLVDQPAEAGFQGDATPAGPANDPGATEAAAFAPALDPAAGADYPAAHSMDTEWFAVDREGLVAVFSTGEAGAVPEAAPNPEELDLLARLKEFVAPCEVLQDLSGRITPRHEGPPHVQPYPARGQSAARARSIWERVRALLRRGPAAPPALVPEAAPAEPERFGFPVLMFLRSLEAVRGEIAAGRASAVGCLEHTAVVFREMPVPVARRLHEGGECLGCFYYFGHDEEDYPDPASLGLFRYDHEYGENWISGPYGRMSRPAAPLHVDQMPEDLRDWLMQLRLEGVSFDREPFIQPVDLVPCQSWEAAYLAGDWKTIRAVPGQEDRYREAYAEMQEYGDSGFVYEPPPETA